MRVFLDACVLFPAVVRAIVLGAAEAGIYTPLWSARVLEEWRRAAIAKQGAGAEEVVFNAADAMKIAFPDNSCAADRTLRQALPYLIRRTSMFSHPPSLARLG
jgi:hypothetical protein